jgi:hypothetical protein
MRCNPPAKSPHIRRYCCSGCFGTILFPNVKRRKAWRGRHPFWLKSASVSKSTATYQPTVTCHPNSKFLIPISRLLGPASARTLFHSRDLSRDRKRRKYIVIPGDSDSCPRCRQPMQIREYEGIDEKQSNQSFFTSLVLLHE